jgi:ATP-dependent Lon protease
LATELANALGVPSDKIGAGGAQGGFQLTGSHSSWAGAKPGAIATLLALSPSSAPVMVIDEVDKIGEDSRYPFLPVLLDLLDAGTARRFKDEFFEMRFNANNVIYVLTANSIEKVPPALLSRVEVFALPSPGPEQRLRIIQQTLSGLNKKTGQHIELVADGAEQLAEQVNIDLRALNRLVTTAFAKAIQSGAHELDLGDRKVTAALKSALEKMSRQVLR